ncbi:putative U2 small nuclear ribonucleoprotein B'' [Wickerhamiella sorbophila]|uniref:Putative U2 small nuclear ribonucleoprotein B n=1 Tax=Wickerhamiella sorbophila TaxID=45607 RepID=A0A2T0FEP7_9ASCO|nr:putative U2 small nuclear ribonucleoprotein B'' [Wickerhamiella sorbophila]PRT53471.1 putative U2 small nuclear ribonucleoprotein B'' [Wickerhamiella sorbophila]
MAKRKAGKPETSAAVKKPRVSETASQPGPPTGLGSTLYVHNLNDQVSIGDLRHTLYMLFSIYGHIVSVNAHKSPKMRGQAHIVYAREECAARALAKLQERPVFGKPLKISYAKARSHILDKLESKLES